MVPHYSSICFSRPFFPFLLLHTSTCIWDDRAAGVLPPSHIFLSEAIKVCLQCSPETHIHKKSCSQLLLAGRVGASHFGEKNAFTSVPVSMINSKGEPTVCLGVLLCCGGRRSWNSKARERQMSGCHYTGCVDLNIPLFFAPFVFCGSDLRAAIGCSTARAEQIVANPWKRKCFFGIENLKCFYSEFEGPAMTQGIMIPRFQNCLNF